MCLLAMIVLCGAFNVARRTSSLVRPIPASNGSDKVKKQSILSLRGNIIIYDSPMAPKRREKKNKYSNFSKIATKKALESVEEAMTMSNEREKEKETDKGLAVRGTTVPTLTASPKIKESAARFTNYRSIVPSDPFTFGYIEIGTVGPPHGIKGEIKIYMHNTDFALERLKKGSLLYIRKPSRRSPRPVRIVSARKQDKDMWLVHFESIISRISAAAFRNFKVYVRAEDRPEMAVDEYLVRDLVGLICLVKRGCRGDSTTRGHDERGALDIMRKAQQEQEQEQEQDLYERVAVVHGVVPPDALCDPGVRHLMHAMLELRLTEAGAVGVGGVVEEYDDDDDDDGAAALCLVPLVPSIVLSVDLVKGVIILDPPPGLLDFTYREKPRRVPIRGFLPAQAGVNDSHRSELSRGQRSTGGATA